MGSCANVPRMAEQPAPLSPSDRLLCGPGPTNVDPAALDAMRKPMLGHLDPELHDILLDLVGRLRSTYRAESGIVLPLQSTGTSGIPGTVGLTPGTGGAGDPSTTFAPLRPVVSASGAPRVLLEGFGLSPIMT